ncbi:MAG: PQQ-binding-like beta-propeller repeat protein [Planctomycetes bacterium]|nr:PQQ-binding-like beta-propeller repeat protein [Planctomycetota bacterium]
MKFILRMAAFGACAGMAALPSAWGTPAQDREGAYIDAVRKDYLDRIDRFREAKDWKGLFNAYGEAFEPRLAHKVVQPDPKRPLWIGLIEYLNRRFADLPKEALDYYRGIHDGPARLEYRQARETDDRSALLRLVETYFFSSVADEALDLLGSLYLEEGKQPEACSCWRRLLEHYPDSDIPAHVTAARLASAAERGGNESALNWLRRFVATREIDGKLWVGERETTLKRHLSELRIEPCAAPDRAVERTETGVRNEIKRWSYEFEVGRRRAAAAARSPLAWEFPYRPAATRLDGREVVMFTDGSQVVAVDPAKVGRDRSSSKAGILWMFPADEPIRVNSRVRRGTYSLPVIGVSVHGSQAFATLYSERPRTAGIRDPFMGIQRLVGLDLRTGKALWDTDADEWWDGARRSRFEFVDHNFTFCAPPVAVGDRLYVGLSTAPLGEQESSVLCLDRRTGRPIWERFLASFTTVGRTLAGGTRMTYLTMIAEEEGTVCVLTNVGVMAALNSMTGSVLWMSKYQREETSGRRRIRRAPFIRFASPLAFHRGRVYALPQDQDELQAFDMATGDSVDLEVMARLRPFRWKEISHLVGVAGDMLVLGGGEPNGTVVLRLADSMERDEKGEPRYRAGTWYKLPGSVVDRSGWGTIRDGLVYLPTCANYDGGGEGGLSVFDSATWRLVNDPAKHGWKESNLCGNLLVAGRHLVVATATGIDVYTDVATVRAELAPRLEGDPPDPAAWFEYAEILRATGRIDDAMESYEKFVRLSEGDAKHASERRQAMARLFDFHMERAAAAGRTDERAIALYRTAKRFATDGASRAKVSRLLGAFLLERAEGFERKGQWDQVVSTLREIRDDHPEAWTPKLRKKLDEALRRLGKREI